MASFNRVILVGNLTRDPEVRYTPGGTAVTDIGLAVNRQWFDKQTNSRREEVTFLDVTLWGRQAEVAGQYLSKGRPVLIEGRLQMDSWDDRETGQKRSKMKVVGENIQFLGGRGEGESPSNAASPRRSSEPSTASAGSAGSAASAASADAGESSDPASSFYDNDPSDAGGGGDDDVPF